MIKYALIYSVGVSTGFKEFIGIYDTVEKANEAKVRDMRSSRHLLRDEREYSIIVIELNKDIGVVYADW